MLTKLTFHGDAGTLAATTTALAIAASSLLYVAVADLIPSLHRRPEPVETAKQLMLIGLGIAVIAIAHVALEH